MDKLISILKLILVTFLTFLLTYLCFVIVTSVTVCIAQLDYAKTIQTLNPVYLIICLIVSLIVNYVFGRSTQLYSKFTLNPEEQ
jgi:hypothetical protein